MTLTTILLQGETLTGAKDLGVAGIFVLLVLEKLLPIVATATKKKNGSGDPMSPAQLRAVVEDQADRELLRKIGSMQVSIAEAVAQIKAVLDRLEKLAEPIIKTWQQQGGGQRSGR